MSAGKGEVAQNLRLAVASLKSAITHKDAVFTDYDCKGIDRRQTDRFLKEALQKLESAADTLTVTSSQAEGSTPESAKLKRRKTE